MKMSVDQVFRKAHALSRDGEKGEAERLYRDILDRFPGNRRALEELKALLTPKVENPPQAELDGLIALYRQGNMAEALAHANALLVRYPHGEILHNIAGGLSNALGRVDAAIGHYDQAIALAPDYVEAYNNRGNALQASDKLPEALADFDEALRLKADYPQAHMNRGIVLGRLKRADEALQSFDIALRLQPGLPQAYSNRANVLRHLNRLDEALVAVDEALRLSPVYADAHVNRGAILQALKRPEDALVSLDQGIALAPARAEIRYNKGALLRTLRRMDEAYLSLEKALELKPDYAAALSELLFVQAYMCRWAGMERRADLSRLALSGEPLPPFHMLTIDDDPARQQVYAQSLVKDRGIQGKPVAFTPKVPGGKIRIGYFSADFHKHATMYLMIGMLERHDRDRFEIHAFSYGPDQRDEMRQRLVDTVDAFHDVTSLSDEQAAALARAQDIDIAIDLKGYTEGGRSGIFAHRAAPAQVNYLGYPATMGADFIDYIIADRVIVPEESRRSYTETVAYLPNSYQATDCNRVIADRTFTRAELGLPEQGFVFCCFNNNYKITPAEYDIWMRLLQRVEGSVLWLLEDNRWAAENLRVEAAARGIDPVRIIFAERMPQAEHLARQACADLFLDTFIVNAHTTASDALWAGLPVLTKLGKSMVARVAGSLLHAVNLPELVTETDEAYEQLAFELATDPVRMDAIKATLAANRLTAPLFDTERYTRDIEQLYAQIHDGTI